MEIFYFVALKFTKLTSKKDLASDLTSTFASESTIHGIQFIFDPDRKYFIKLFWILAFLAAFGLCFYNARGNFITLMIEPEVEKNQEQKLSSEIPFPTIAIYITVFAKNALANFTRSVILWHKNNNQYLNISRKETKFLIANTHRFTPNFIKYFQSSTNFSERFDIVDHMNRSQYLTDEIMHDCKLGGKLINCSKIIRRGLNGFSINQQSFNEIFRREISSDFYLSEGSNENSEWSLDEGYKTSSKSSYPFRATEENSFEITLKISEEDATNTYNGNKQNLIYFMKPNEISSSSQPFKIEFNKLKTFKISAKVSTYSEDFRRFSPENRGCLFGDEKQLKFFKSYTEQNCLDECFANDTLKTCNCVKFSMPRNDTTPVCIFGQDTDCYWEVYLKFPRKGLGDPPCGCFKTCNDIKYFVERKTNVILGKSEKILTKSKNGTLSKK